MQLTNVSMQMKKSEKAKPIHRRDSRDFRSDRIKSKSALED